MGLAGRTAKEQLSGSIISDPPLIRTRAASGTPREQTEWARRYRIPRKYLNRALGSRMAARSAACMRTGMPRRSCAGSEGADGLFHLPLRICFTLTPVSGINSLQTRSSSNASDNSNSIPLSETFSPPKPQSAVHDTVAGIAWQSNDEVTSLDARNVVDIERRIGEKEDQIHFRLPDGAIANVGCSLSGTFSFRD